MATVSAFICPSANQTIASDGGPSCTSGAGQWQQIVVAEPFDPATLNQEELAGAFGAGFFVMGTGLVIVWAARLVLSSVRSAL